MQTAVVEPLDWIVNCTAAEDWTEILDRLLQGVLLVNSKAQVIFANRAAEDMLRAGRGLLLGRDRLRAETPTETRLLRRAVAECAELSRALGGVPRRLRLSREHHQPLTLFLMPHHAQFGGIDVAPARAILFVTDPETALAVRQNWLREDFELTTAEAAVSLEILRAEGVHAAALRLGISMTTARTHLAHVFDKTGTRRQAELVRLLLQSQPPIRED